MKIIQLSSLAKVYPNKIYGKSKKKIRVAKGQEFSYQIAYKGEGEYSYKIKSSLKDYITVYQLGFVPSNLPIYEKCNDGKYQHTEKGLFPDPLTPKKTKKIKAEKTYNALWINVKLPDDIKSGEHQITIAFSDGTEADFTVYIENLVLENKEIVFTQWFHTDCIANVHKTEIYSEKHWALIEKYIKMATDNGINMLLIPVLTPPLDTAVGGERETTQLVDIVYEDGKYSFGFDKLHRFIEIAKKCGVKYYEINHMFTQWGAQHAPKVIATVNGEKKRIFGWETDALGEEYKTFLESLIPAVIRELHKANIDNEHIVFHASDEPNMNCIENYRKASEILKPLIEDCVQMDALSDYEFYKRGIVKRPVCGIDHIDTFINNGVPNMWGYYCCAQTWDVSNRFFAMSSPRTRIIGTQIYKFALEGFLQWGYNFYNTQYSKKKINPYKVTDAGGAFPSGDSFSVYPYRNDVIPSLRLKVFKEALDDVSLLYMLENKIGREKTIALLDEVAKQEITFKSYPDDEKFFDKLTNTIFDMLRTKN